MEKKTSLLFVMVAILFAACGGNNNLAVFNIGDSRDKVINTIVNDFMVDGKSLTKEQVLDQENGNHITLYNCTYKGQQYHKFRVCYSEEKVRRIEIKIEKSKIDDVLGKMEDDFGTPHKTKLPRGFGSEVEANVFMRENDAAVLIEDDEYYKIYVLSGKDRDELNRQM